MMVKPWGFTIYFAFHRSIAQITAGLLILTRRAVDREIPSGINNFSDVVL
jgi:hypothetical protein